MKKLTLKVLGIIIVGIILFNSSNIVIAANNTTDLNNQQTQTDKKIEDTKNEINNIQSEKSDTLKQVEELTAQISDYESQIRNLETRITQLNKSIEEEQNNLNKAEEDYKEQDELLQARLVASYEAGDTSYLDVLLSSESITDLISNYFLVTELATYDAELLEKIEKQKQEIERAKQALETTKQEVSASKISKQSVSNKLQESKNQKNQYASQLNQEEKAKQLELEQFEADKRAIRTQLAQIAAQEKALAEAAAKKKAEEDANKSSNTGSASGSTDNNSSGGSTSGSGTASTSGFIRPVVGYPITTGWYGYAGHTGVDFSGSGISGKPILAVKSGTVVISTALKTGDTYKSYGEYIVISHGNGVMTLYAHGAPGSRKVTVGQTVSQGQTIMNVGTTGNSTGYHLHFEVLINGSPVNPTPYLP